MAAGVRIRACPLSYSTNSSRQLRVPLPCRSARPISPSGKVRWSRLISSDLRIRLSTPSLLFFCSERNAASALEFLCFASVRRRKRIRPPRQILSSRRFCSGISRCRTRARSISRLSRTAQFKVGTVGGDVVRSLCYGEGGFRLDPCSNAEISVCIAC
jgi:hypothetical protein